MTQEKKFFVPELRTYNQDLSKRWRIEWYVPTPGGGRRCPKPIYSDINKGNTIEDRIARADKIIAALKFDFPKQPKKTNILYHVIDTRKLELRPKTISAYTTVADHFTAWLGRKKPEEIDCHTVNDYLLHVMIHGTVKGKGSKNTIAKYRDTLFTLYKSAVGLKLAKENPVLQEVRIKRSPQSLFFFTDKQIALFQKAEFSQQLGLAIKLLYYCFIRPGEQRHMRISWINFEYQFIEIPAAYSKNGKTQKVSIPDVFLQELLYLQNYPSTHYVLSKDLQPGTRQISTKWLNAEHSKVLKALKITGRYAFYSWKHTGVVKAVKAGINIKDLQLQLRHHSLDMVNEYLKNLGVTDSEDLRAKFPSLFAILTPFKHKAGCTCHVKEDHNYCPECGVKLKAAA